MSGFWGLAWEPASRIEVYTLASSLGLWGTARIASAQERRHLLLGGTAIGLAGGAHAIVGAALGLASLILVTRRASIRELGGRFGFGWFVPAILKYRGLFAEVLAASFFLQLFALITPLFFQVIIDKVLVHRGLTTLDVLAIGLLAVSLFEVVLGGLRSYVFSHTTKRTAS